MAYLPFQASSYTTFHKNHGRGENFWTVTCHKTVFVSKQGHASCKTPFLQQGLFSYLSNVMEFIRLLQRLGKSGHSQYWGYYGFKAVVSVCHCDSLMIPMKFK